MPGINEIAYYKNRRDEIPNQELAARLAQSEDREGLKEIAGHLNDKNSSIASDCIKLLYEAGYLKPELIAPFVLEFLRLLESKRNRMVWGGMIALSTIAEISSEEIWNELPLILATINKGTIITQVSGIRVLVGLCKAKETYKRKILSLLFEYLENCRPVDFSTRTETILPLIATPDEREVFKQIIRIKKGELSDAQKKKLNSVLRKISWYESGAD